MPSRTFTVSVELTEEDDQILREYLLGLAKQMRGVLADKLDASDRIFAEAMQGNVTQETIDQLLRAMLVGDVESVLRLSRERGAANVVEDSLATMHKLAPDAFPLSKEMASDGDAD